MFFLLNIDELMVNYEFFNTSMSSLISLVVYTLFDYFSTVMADDESNKGRQLLTS